MSHAPRFHPYTSHALERFLERVRGLDLTPYKGSFTAMHFAGLPVNAARAKLTEIATRMHTLGARKITLDGFEYISDGEVLVTVSIRNCRGLGAAGKGKRLKVARISRDRKTGRRDLGAEQLEAAE